jgi:uncharacterized membrane protein
MNSSETRSWSFWAAILTMGLMAGIFFVFSISVMPALSSTPDSVFVPAMQAINAAIENLLFAVAFAGALVFTAVAAWRHRRSPAFAWIVAALVLYLITLGITMGVNVPLNEKLADDGNRAAFEGIWVAANIVRTVSCVLGFSALAWAALKLRAAVPVTGQSS